MEFKSSGRQRIIPLDPEEKKTYYKNIRASFKKKKNQLNKQIKIDELLKIIIEMSNLLIGQDLSQKTINQLKKLKDQYENDFDFDMEGQIIKNVADHEVNPK